MTMAKQRRKSSRKKRKSASELKNIVILVIAIISICSFAYSSCNNDIDETSSRLAGSAELGQLARVVYPDDINDAIMLHYPGFDVLFSKNHRQPYYASWILTPEHAAASEFSRSNNFRPDPDVEESPTLSDYRGSGYDRGHMAPSADFRYSKEAQEATFFLTNMSPQKNTLNSKAWANLEDQCRAWALRDSTLIIIAGPILSDVLDESIGKNKITVPARYFKVVLAPFANPPRAIGFIMPNGYVEGGVQATAMSVDQVEDITGFDFFSALPDDVENQIEASAKYSHWQYPKKRKK